MTDTGPHASRTTPTEGLTDTDASTPRWLRSPGLLALALFGLTATVNLIIGAAHLTLETDLAGAQAGLRASAPIVLASYLGWRTGTLLPRRDRWLIAIWNFALWCALSVLAILLQLAVPHDPTGPLAEISTQDPTVLFMVLAGMMLFSGVFIPVDYFLIRSGEKLGCNQIRKSSPPAG